MDAERQVLRISIDGRWEASEFGQSLSALDRLYTLRFGLDLEKQNLRELRNVYRDTPFPPFSRSVPLGEVGAISSELLEPDERLVVQRVIYGSPGIKDLVGVGEIVGHLKDLLIRLIDHWSTKQERVLKNERLALENRQLQVDVAKQFVGLAEELGYTKREMRQLVAAVIHEQQPLVRLIGDGKITSADSIDESLL